MSEAENIHTDHSQASTTDGNPLKKPGRVTGKKRRAGKPNKRASLEQDSVFLGGTDGTDGTASNNKASAGSADKIADGTGGTLDLGMIETHAVDPLNDPIGAKPGKFPGYEERPCYRVYEDFCGPDGKHKPGVWYHGRKDAGEDSPPVLFDDWICSPLHVEAVTCTADTGRFFGRLLRFVDTYGRWREWAMPMELLRGSCEEVRGELLAAGVAIDHRGRGKLPDYLQSRTPKRRVVSALRTGWTPDGSAFVLPDQVIGDGDVIFQSESITTDGSAAVAGEFDKWKSEVAAMAVGNPVLALSVCVALAVPLLAKVHRDSGGVHWTGDSSSGKTTALIIGASVWGGETFRRTWRATANGLEGAAAALNDTCLCLDEIGQADPREVGSIVYALGNGIGKQRAHKIGSARACFKWRVSLLSTGEKTLEAQMAEGGKQAKAGQLVRLLNIPTARTFGIFDVLHEFEEGRGRALADHLKTMAGQHYGHAGPAFVTAMLVDGRDFGSELAKVEGIPQFQAHDGQESRAASRFALYGMAGELAAEWGVLPWPEGEAMSAAAEAYRVWRGSRGNGTTEKRQMLQAVGDFIAKHGDSRFTPKDSREETDVCRDRAGWWGHGGNGERVFMFTPTALREATAGHDLKAVLDALDAAGWICEKGEGSNRGKKTEAGGRKQRLYWIMPKEDS